MFPSLSDNTKSFLAACAVLAVAVCNVVFGMDWVGERPAVRPVAAVTGVSEPPVARESAGAGREPGAAGRVKRAAPNQQPRPAAPSCAAPERHRSNE